MSNYQKKYRLVVFIRGQKDQKLLGSWSTELKQVEEELAVISNAKAGSNALVALPWMTVRESEIVAAQIEEKWSGGGGGAGSIPSSLGDQVF